MLAKLHDMYLYKTTTFPHQPLKSSSKVAVLHRRYYRPFQNVHGVSEDKQEVIKVTTFVKLANECPISRNTFEQEARHMYDELLI